jgi:hypothetical protein
MSESQQEKQSIEELTRRYAALHKKQIAAETNMQNAEAHLEGLRETAVAEYGTADLDELRKLLEQRKTDNERKRSDYQQLLDSIDSELQSVQEKYSESEDSALDEK